MGENGITVKKSPHPKPKPEVDQLGFGQMFTDHMFLMDYTEGEGWHDPRIVPYAPFTLDPSAMVFHYGQAVFEGLKAYRWEDGHAVLFRLEKHAKRLNQSCERLGIPTIDESMILRAIRTFVQVEKVWIPQRQGTSLYIRPFIIASEASLGIRISKRYLFAIIASPSGAYYAEGMKPLSILVENSDVRAVRGGLGFAKTPANYASGLNAQTRAKSGGADQVLWLDALHRKYIEEAGNMNVFFVVGDMVWTPQLSGSILDGVTRDSVLRLLANWGIRTEVRQVAIDDIILAASNGRLKEAFGTGTAAVVSPIGRMIWNDQQYVLNEGRAGQLTQRLYDTLTGIQYGQYDDPFGWVERVD